MYTTPPHTRSQFSMMKPLHEQQCCLFLSLVLTQVHFLSATSGNYIVVQSPYNLTLSKGETAQIHCSWNKSSDSLKITVNWFFYHNSSHESKIKLKDSERITISSEKNSTLVINSVSSNDSGLYVCEVIQEIPVLRTYSGTGTQLTVNSESKSKGTTETNLYATDGFPLGITVASAVVVGLLLSCVPVIIWKKKTTQLVIRGTSSDGEEHIDQHGEEAESNSNSSRGSTQWCQVPVYEAYFDHRRDGEDG